MDLMSRTFGRFPVNELVELLKGPGIDTRAWVSMALVDKDQSEEDGGKAVVFSPEYGPLVNVTLQPAGIPVRARVAGTVAGNGEGEWFPFLEGDEVLVVMPEGSPGNAVIVGRMNQEIDAFPTMVAGNEVSGNNFAFRRMRVPYVIETASSYLVRSAVTGTYFGIEANGNMTFSDSSGGFFHLGADFIGMQSGDGEMLLQLDYTNKLIRMSVDGSAIFDWSSTKAQAATPGTFSISTSGNPPFGTITTAQSTVLFVSQVLNALGVALNLLGPTPLTGTMLGAMLVDPANLPLILAAITASTPPVGVLSQAVLSAINAALLGPKSPDPATGATTPGLGCVGFTVGLWQVHHHHPTHHRYNNKINRWLARGSLLVRPLLACVGLHSLRSGCFSI